VSSEAKKLKTIQSSYDALAEEYANRFFHELDQRPRERELLERFAGGCRGRGLICDLGCGPGHVAGFLRRFNPEVIGLDLSHQALVQARQRNAEIVFLQGDMLDLPIAIGMLSGIVAFYSIIHFEGPQLDRALAEMHRVLVTEGELLLGFHVGSETVHVDEELGVRVDLDARFFTMDELVKSVEKLGFSVVEKFQRDPYPEIEYQSVRGYLRAAKRG
jgi:SAM-dependent methyltransferase